MIKSILLITTILTGSAAYAAEPVESKKGMYISGSMGITLSEKFDKGFQIGETNVIGTDRSSDSGTPYTAALGYDYGKFRFEIQGLRRGSKLSGKVSQNSLFSDDLITKEFNYYTGPVEEEVAHRDDDQGTEHMSVDHRQKGETSGKVRTNAIMLNTWFDFENSSRFTPYIGGGIGLAKVSGSYSGSLEGHTGIRRQYLDSNGDPIPEGARLHGRTGTGTEDDPYVAGAYLVPDETYIPDLDVTNSILDHDGSDTVFAYQLGAGMAFRVTDNLAVDLGYSLLNTGKADFTGEGAVNHTLNTGIRYTF